MPRQVSEHQSFAFDESAEHISRSRGTVSIPAHLPTCDSILSAPMTIFEREASFS
jgi:hypothetical protein